MKFLKFFNLCCMLLCVMFVHGQSSRISVEEYIKRYQRLAIEEMYRAKIPASITMAQALLESGAGNSELSINQTIILELNAKAIG